jgi:hypothetical protein
MDDVKKITQGLLPEGLSFDHTNVTVVEILGEPHDKGGNNVPVWIEYQDKGLQINFKGLSFEDRTNPIASITIFPPDPTGMRLSLSLSLSL